MPVPVSVIEDDRQHTMAYAQSLPYAAALGPETETWLPDIVDHVFLCIRVGDYTGGGMWVKQLISYMDLKHALPRALRAQLAAALYDLAVTPGMEYPLVELWATVCARLIKNKKKLSPDDLTLPWKPLYDTIDRCAFPKARQKTSLSDQSYLLSLTRLAEYAQRYFAAEAGQEILDVVLPRYTTHSVHDMIVAQGYLGLFLPTSTTGSVTPQLYLPLIFSLWSTSTRSSSHDSQFMDLVSRIARDQLAAADTYWTNDVGVFTKEQINVVFTCAVRMMCLPVGSKSNDGTNTGTANTGYGVAGYKVDMKAINAAVLQRKSSKCLSLAKFIICTMTPGQNDDENNKHSYGYVLTQLGELIQAVELYFHPSNHGTWSYILTTFIRFLSYGFLKRWREEQEPDCETPAHRRLTPAMRRHFVEMIRPVAFLSMFGKDHHTVAASEVTIRFLAWLEPDLIFPSLLERVYPSLETLTETHRTTSALSIIADVALPLLARDHYPSGGRHLLPLLHLAIPGIDMNDPIKTITALMFITNAIMTVPVYDLTMEPDDDVAMEDVDPMVIMTDENEFHQKLPRALEDQLCKMTTGQFEEWLAKFLRRIFTILENMPQHDRKKQGNSMEAGLTQIMLHSCEIVFSQLSDTMFDIALRLIADFATEQVLPNAVRALGSLCEAITAANPVKAGKRFIPICCEQIQSELEHGASSTMTHAASATPIQSDATLHWYQHILFSVVSSMGDAWLLHRVELVAIGQMMVTHCKTRRGMMWTGKFLRYSLKTLLCTFPLEYRSLPPQDWADSAKMARSHQTWGQPGDPAHLDIQWHVPNDQEKNAALELLDSFLHPAIDRLRTLMSSSQNASSNEITNDFCRQLAVVRNCLMGSLMMVADDGEDKTTLNAFPNEDDNDISETYPTRSTMVECGYAFNDENDARTAKARQIRARIGDLLHELAAFFTSERENDVESIKILIKIISTYMTQRGVDKSWLDRVRSGYSYSKNLFKAPGDKKRYPRSLLVLRAYILHLQRLKHNATRRLRAPIHDTLLKDLLQLSISSYSEIRKVAQSALESSARCYISSRRVLTPDILAMLEPRPDLDEMAAKQRMKGALYLLKQKWIQRGCFENWRHVPTFILCMCKAHHSDDLSIQELIRKLFLEYMGQFYQCSFKVLAKAQPRNDAEVALQQRVLGQLTRRRAAHEQLMHDLVILLQNDKMHWRFATMAANFLELLIRADQPPTREMANIFVRLCLVSELPAMRRIGISGVIQLLLFIKQRTFAQGNLDLIIMRAVRNPLKQTRPLASIFPGNDPTRQFLAAADKPVTADSFLIEDPTTGFFAWPKEVTGYAVMTDTTELPKMDGASQEAFDALLEAFSSEAHWQKMMDYMSQEAMQKQEERFSSANVRLYASIVAMFHEHPQVMACARAQLERLCALTDQKHMQRAASELMAGLIRGTKHWPMDKVDALWQDWLQALVTNTLANATPDTQSYWSTFLRCSSSRRDPRRLVPLVQAVLSTGFDATSDAAFSEASKLMFIHALIMGIKWRFQPWGTPLLSDYVSHLDHPYKQVREVLGRNINDIMQIQWVPGFASVALALQPREGDRDGVHSTPFGIDASDAFVQPILRALEAERQQEADNNHATSKSVLCWLRDALSTWHVAGSLRWIPVFLPSVFNMLELSDDQDLQQTTTRVLHKMAQTNVPLCMIPRVVDQLLEILTTSPNWHIRVRTLPLLQVFYFKHLFLLNGSDNHVGRIMDAVGGLLLDHRLEVRHMASTTLGGLVRCSERDAIDTLRTRYTTLLLDTKLPKRHRNDQGKWVEPQGYQDALLRKHAGVLGLACLVNAFPYEVPDWMPTVLCDLANCMSVPAAEIQSTICTTFSDFRRTHSDTWHEDMAKFDENQLSLLSDMLISPSYYA